MPGTVAAHRIDPIADKPKVDHCIAAASDEFLDGDRLVADLWRELAEKALVWVQYSEAAPIIEMTMPFTHDQQGLHVSGQ